MISLEALLLMQCSANFQPHLQNEHSIVGNFPDVIMVQHFGSPEQKRELIEGRLQRKVRITFGLTEPGHGSDATHMETHAEKQADDTWVINGAKMWQTGMHKATNCFIFARTSGKNGDPKGITCFNVPRQTPGIKVESYEVSPVLVFCGELALIVFYSGH